MVEVNLKTRREPAVAYVANTLTLLVGLLLLSCATQKVLIRTNAPAVVSVHEWNALEQDGTMLGNAPLDVEQDNVENKVIKISAEGKVPQYWVFTSLQGSEVNIRTQLLDLPAGKPSEEDKPKDEEKPNDDKKDDGEDKNNSIFLNQTYRLLMRSYQALASKNFVEAVELAENLKKIMPNISAPDILIGLSRLQEGKLQEARASFSSAKALDPSDTAIDQLLELTQ